MSINWSPDRDKVLCRCGVVSWTNTRMDGNPPKYVTKDPCIGCEKTDDIDEICSIEKMSLKKAIRIVEALCSLVEIDPIQLLNGRVGLLVEDLARDIEDVNRPKAAERIRKALKVIKDGMLKGASSMFPGMAPQKPEPKDQSFVLVSRPPSQKPPTNSVVMVPGCRKCPNAILDYKPEWRWHLHGIFCSKCLSALDDASKIEITEERIAETTKFASQMAEGLILMNKQIEELKR